jgi:hypothetical protein
MAVAVAAVVKAAKAVAAMVKVAKAVAERAVMVVIY